MSQRFSTKKIFPFLEWLPLVNKSTLRSDFVAGLTGAIILLTQGVAYALIAGLPPEYGLYAAMIVPIVVAFFGSSHHLIAGPTTPISIVVFAAIVQFAEPSSPQFIQLALSLTFLAGIFQLVLGFARMGALVNFVSHSVIIGFTAGAAILIATKQLKHVLGIEISKGASFVDTWWEVFEKFGQINIYVFAIAAATFLAAFLFKKLLPRSPFMLLAIIMAAILSIILNAKAHGVAHIGAISSQLPPFSTPDLSFSTLTLLAPNAFAIALLGLIEAVSVSRSLALHTQQKIDSNQEFIGQGIGNVATSFFSGYASSGSFTRSGINLQSGAKTPLAAIFASIFLMITVLLIAPYASYIPMPAMGGIILLVAISLVDIPKIKAVFKASKAETIVLVVTFLATLFLELEFAIYIGVIFSLIFYLQRTSRPKIVPIAPNKKKNNRSFSRVKNEDFLHQCPQLKVIRIDGSLFYGAINHIETEISEIRKTIPQKNLLITCAGINLIDLSGVEWLCAEAKRWEEKGGKLYLCGLKKEALHYLKRGGYMKQIGAENIFDSKKAAIVHIYTQLDRNTCDMCVARIFSECEKDYKIDKLIETYM